MKALLAEVLAAEDRTGETQTFDRIIPKAEGFRQIMFQNLLPPHRMTSGPVAESQLFRSR